MKPYRPGGRIVKVFVFLVFVLAAAAPVAADVCEGDACVTKRPEVPVAPAFDGGTGNPGVFGGGMGAGHPGVFGGGMGVGHPGVFGGAW